MTWKLVQVNYYDIKFKWNPTQEKSGECIKYLFFKKKWGTVVFDILSLYHSMKKSKTGTLQLFWFLTEITNTVGNSVEKEQS